MTKEVKGAMRERVGRQQRVGKERWNRLFYNGTE